jgi:hypothetical protein
VAVAIFARGTFENIVVGRQDIKELRDESFTMARVVSPLTSTTIFIVIVAFVYNWTGVAGNTFIVAAIFSIPYLFAFIRFNSNEKIKVEKIQRNILLEALFLALISFVIFRQISVTPVSLEKRVEVFLLISGIAPAIHAFLSAIYSSNEDKFSFEQKTEII